MLCYQTAVFYNFISFKDSKLKSLKTTMKCINFTSYDIIIIILLILYCTFISIFYHNILIAIFYTNLNIA